jgi:hypothetical protein
MIEGMRPMNKKDSLARREGGGVRRMEEPMDIEVVGRRQPTSLQTIFPWFRMSYHSVTRVGGQTHVVHKEMTYEDGHLETAEFEGVTDPEAYNESVAQMQETWFGMMRAFGGPVMSLFLPPPRKK